MPDRPRNQGDKTTPSPRTITPGVCPSCDGTQFHVLQVPNDGPTLDVCTGCGMYINAGAVQGERIEETYDGDYQEALYGRSARRKLRDSRRRLRVIEALRRPGAFLDIGCSLGYFVQAATDNGWDAHGVDISEYAAARCRERGLQVIVGDMQHLDFPDATFDIVNLRHVLEHDADLWRSLAEIRRVLKPEGLLILEVPCVECLQVRLWRERYVKFWHPYHYYWFSRRSVRNILTRAEYQEVPMPRYGRAFSGTVMDNLRFVLWRTHAHLRRVIGLGSFDASAWQPATDVK